MLDLVFPAVGGFGPLAFVRREWNRRGELKGRTRWYIGDGRSELRLVWGYTTIKLAYENPTRPMHYLTEYSTPEPRVGWDAGATRGGSSGKAVSWNLPLLYLT